MKDKKKSEENNRISEWHGKTDNKPESIRDAHKIKMTEFFNVTRCWNIKREQERTQSEAKRNVPRKIVKWTNKYINNYGK